MSGKESFTPDEWTRVVASPVLSGMAITAADPSGLWGIAKEGMAAGWALLEAKQGRPPNTLVKAVADDFASSEARTKAQDRLKATFQSSPNSQISDLRTKAIDELRTVGGILDAKAPQDAAAFKNWLREIAQKAAEAAKEGGFLGFGGVAVSDAEKLTLAEIGTALGHLTSSVDAPPPERPSHELTENAPTTLDDKLDNAVDETFPASDPVSVRITK